MATHPASAPQPNAGIVFDAMFAYQRSMALKGALDLELFTHIADGATGISDLAKKTSSAERGIRILCDFLVVHGFLTKLDGTYGLSPEASAFLNKRSPAYMGSMANFLAHPTLRGEFDDVAAAVRRGGTVKEDTAAVPNNPLWVEFARSMVPMARMSGQRIAPQVTEPGKAMKVLDIAAGHGYYGIAVALHNSAAQIFAVDWPKVLEVAVEHAYAEGVADRYQTIAGSAFTVDFGAEYDVVLVPNFLHHFDSSTNVEFLKKVRSAMKPGAMAATVEFVPNDDRVSPREAAAFSLSMLAGTANGDAYTFRELDQMFRDAGFGESVLRPLDPIPQQLILTRN